MDAFRANQGQVNQGQYNFIVARFRNPTLAYLCYAVYLFRRDQFE